MADTVADKFIQQYESALSDRRIWDSHWDDLARVTLPRRQGFVTQTTEGDRRMEDNFDGTPIQAARGLSNAIDGFLWPDGQTTHTIKPEDDELENMDEVKEWLDQANEELHESMENPRARFRQSRGEISSDLSVFGSGVMFIGEPASRNNLLYQSLHLKDAVVIWGEEGEPLGIMRMKRFTVQQVADKITAGEWKNISDTLRQKIQNGQNMQEKVKFLHVVMRRPGGRVDAMLAKNLPYTHTWVEFDDRQRVSEGGFHEFPFVVPRWDTSSGEDWGRSPGMIALPDSNTLQAMGETMLVAGQRAADPPLLYPNDGFFNEANTFPGGMSAYDVETAAQVGGNPVFPLQTGGSMPLTREMQMDVREQVWAAFFRNVLNLPTNGPQMTATEVIQRKEEFIREIGPVFGRLESDYVAPTVERSFNILLRANALPPIPEVLQGRNIRFEYDSPVKRVRQQIEAAAAQMWVREHIEIATATGRPDILDRVNFDKYSELTQEYAKIPHELANDEETVQAIRQQRDKAEEAARQAAAQEQMVNMAKTGADAAKSAGITEAA